MPEVDVKIEISGRFLSDFERLDAVGLHLLDTLQRIFDLDFVLLIVRNKHSCQARPKSRSCYVERWRWKSRVEMKIWLTEGSAQPWPQFPRGPLITK
jgi:hypothetical protein